LYFGSFDIGWKALAGALGEDSHFLAGEESGRICKAVKNPLTDALDNVFELDKFTILAKVRAAFVSGIGRKKGPVGCNDFKRKKAQQIGDMHEGMKDAIVQGFAQAVFEIGECGLTGDNPMIDAGVESVVFAFDRIAQDIDERFHVGILFDISEKLQQEEADGIIGKADGAVPVGHDGSDKREIDQRRYESSQSADNTSVGIDFDIPALVGIFG